MLKLQFGHDCVNTGCIKPGCQLCRNNPRRRCQTHFKAKYIDNVNRVFTAGCGAPLLVRIWSIQGKEFLSEAAVAGLLSSVQLQLCVLDDILYGKKEADIGKDNFGHHDYEGLMVLNNANSPSAPLLVPGRGCSGAHTPDHKLNIPLQGASTPVLVRTSRPTQDPQGGRTKFIRLLARAVGPDRNPLPVILPDVSEPFAVLSRRMQASEKTLYPRHDDEVGKLVGVGKECASKLADLKAAGLTAPLANYRIETAGQLADLLDKADTGLLLDLGTILGMNKFKELQQRLQAVPVARPDTRPRMWISPANPAERLVFDCQRGAIDPLKEPLEVVIAPSEQAGAPPSAALSQQQRGLQLRQLAYASWWADGHPGWRIVDNSPAPQQHRRTDYRTVHSTAATVVTSVPLSHRWQGIAIPKPPPSRPVSTENPTSSSTSSGGPSTGSGGSRLYHSIDINQSRRPASSFLGAFGGAAPQPGPSSTESFTSPAVDDLPSDPLTLAALEYKSSVAHMQAAPPAGAPQRVRDPSVTQQEGATRVKRSASGNREKPLPPNVVSDTMPASTGASTPPPDFASTGASPPPPAFSFDTFQQFAAASAEAPLLPDLDMQSPLNKVDSWQIFRPQSSFISDIEERLSNMLRGLNTNDLHFDPFDDLEDMVGEAPEPAME